MVITSSEQICVTVHVGANILIFDLVLTISPQIPGHQPCSRYDTEEIKQLNYNIKYLNYNLVCVFFSKFCIEYTWWGDGKGKNYIVLLGKKCVLELVTYLTTYLLL